MYLLDRAPGTSEVNATLAVEDRPSRTAWDATPAPPLADEVTVNESHRVDGVPGYGFVTVDIRWDPVGDDNRSIWLAQAVETSLLDRPAVFEGWRLVDASDGVHLVLLSSQERHDVYYVGVTFI